MGRICINCFLFMELSFNLQRKKIKNEKYKLKGEASLKYLIRQQNLKDLNSISDEWVSSLIHIIPGGIIPGVVKI